MDPMAIAALATGMHAQQTMQAVETTMLKKTMESQEAQAMSLIEQMASSQPAPLSGHLLNAYA